MSEKAWGVDIDTRSCRQEPAPSVWRRLGGRGFIARTLLDGIPASRDWAIDQENALVTRQRMEYSLARIRQLQMLVDSKMIGKQL